MLLHTFLALFASFLATVVPGTPPPMQTPAPAGALKFTAPKGWESRTPSSTMRVGEFVAPGVNGSAELVVYYFGGTGGSVDANIQRWLGQMQQPDGKATSDVARRETKTINGLEVSLLDVSGTYVAEMRPGATEKHNSPGFRMRTAVITTPKGPYFLKFVGPATTVEAWKTGFDQFLNSLKFEP
jgi:hypothetical protein